MYLSYRDLVTPLISGRLTLSRAEQDTFCIPPEDIHRNGREGENDGPVQISARPGRNDGVNVHALSPEADAARIGRRPRSGQ